MRYEAIVVVMILGMLTGARATAKDAVAPEAKEVVQAQVSVRAITQGPKSHWFGYYDKHEFDPSGRYVLGMEVDFHGRTPTPEDVIRVGYVDLERGDAWTVIGESHAWGWQQGCMLQWLPGSDSEVIYNDRRDGTFVAVIQDVFTGAKRIIPRAIYTVSPDGKTGLSPNFARIQDTRPGYGYKGGTDPHQDELHPDDAGIFRVDLETGESKLVVSHAKIAAIPWDDAPEGKNWFNHLLFNTDGSRFIFLHRAYRKAFKEGHWVTRMFTANPDGTDLYCVADHTMVSHFIWRNPRQILAWSTEPERGNRFRLYDDQTGKIEVIGDGVLKVDGHCTYSPDGTWILTDTYPGKDRMQTLMLYRPDDGKLVIVGKLFHPREHKGEWRCDLHPRWNRDGSKVCVDSLANGHRQLYLIDVSSITGAESK